MEHLVDSLGYLLKGHGPAYLNVFDKVTAPVFGPLLASAQPASLRCDLSKYADVIGLAQTMPRTRVVAPPTTVKPYFPPLCATVCPSAYWS